MQALSADLVHDGKAVLRGHGHLPRLQRRMVHGVALGVQQGDLLAGCHQQAAVQIGVDAGAVAVVLVELGAAALVLFCLHIGNAAAQAVKGGAIQQYKGRHRRQHQSNHCQQHPQRFAGRRFLFDALGRFLLGIAHFKFHLFHSVVHPHTRPV